MASTILAIRLVPPDRFADLLGELRARHPGAHIVALSASPAATGASIAQSGNAADETVEWRGRRARELASELRGRRFDLLVVAHGRDHYATRAYWKTALLARAVRAGETLWCEETLDRAHSPLAGAGRGAAQAGEVVLAGAVGLALLSLVLVMAAATDLTEALAGPRAGRG